MAIKLGYISHKNNENNLNLQGAREANNEEPHASTSNPKPHADTITAQTHTEQRLFRSLNPPQASLLKFHGEPEEFAEYCAIFETVVHKSDWLDVVEKLIILRESLEGRVRSCIQGIQPLPENYN